ncbi:PREDICTED: uncharacterized protein LOC101313006 [Fragaria vesca subsp. vesca]
MPALSTSYCSGNVEQKEPAEPSSVKSNAVKDDDSEDDHDSDDEDEETPTPSKTGSKKRARASTSAKNPVSAGKAKIDTDGDKGAYRETPHTTEKGMSPELVKWMESFKILYRTPGGFTVSQRQA